MNNKIIFAQGAIFLLILAGSCSARLSDQDTSREANLPNPASEFCIEQGYKLEIVTAGDGSQSGICLFDDGSSCDEWAYFRGDCGPSALKNAPGATADTTSPTSSPADSLSNPTINPADYQGWWTFTHPEYGFSLLVPQDWIVEEISPNDPLLGGHLINLHPSVSIHGENIRITFKQTGEETLLWPTGVGQGEFIPTGTLEIDGEPALRYQLVCPSGETTSIWYHQTEGLPAITRGGLEFSFIFHASSFHCEPGLTLDGEKQLLGEKIISSLSVE